MITKITMNSVASFKAPAYLETNKKVNLIYGLNSTVTELINKLQNSDWVKADLQYLPEEIDETAEPYPFCQKNTITKSLLKNIQSFFDETYENNIKELKNILTSYDTTISALPTKETYEPNPFVVEKQKEATISKMETVQSFNKVIGFILEHTTQYSLLGTNCPQIEAEVL